MLVEVSLPVLDRAVMQSVFGLRRRQAIELMHRFGGYQAGRTFLVERTRLIAELEKVVAGEEYQREVARLEKLASTVAKFQHAQRAREVRIPVSPQVFGTRLSCFRRRCS